MESNFFLPNLNLPPGFKVIYTPCTQAKQSLFTALAEVLAKEITEAQRQALQGYLEGIELFKLCILGLKKIAKYRMRALKLAKVLELANKDNFAFIGIECDPSIDLPIICAKLNNILINRSLNIIELHTICATTKEGSWVLRHELYDSQGNVRLISGEEELSVVAYGKPNVLHLLNYGGGWQEILFEGQTEEIKELSEIASKITNMLQLTGDKERIFYDLNCPYESAILLFDQAERAELINLYNSMLQTEPGNFMGYIELIKLSGVVKERLMTLKKLLQNNYAICSRLSIIEFKTLLKEGIQHIEQLDLRGAEVIWSRLFNFIRIVTTEDQEDSRVKDRRLYGSLLLTDKDLTRIYRRLKAKFHPDNVIKYKAYNWQLPESKQEEGTALLTQLSHQLEDDILRKRSKQELNQKGLYHMEESNANYYWLLGQETLRNYNEYLTEENPHDFQLSEFKRIMESQFGLAKRAYRICCLIQDQEDNLDKQVELRKKISYCYAYSGKLLEAQLYVLSSILLLERRLYTLDGNKIYPIKESDYTLHQELEAHKMAREELRNTKDKYSKDELTLRIQLDKYGKAREKYIQDERSLRIEMDKYKSEAFTLVTTQRLENLPQQISDINAKIAEIEQQVSALNLKIDALNKKISYKSQEELRIEEQLVITQETLLLTEQQIIESGEKIAQLELAIQQEIARITEKLNLAQDLLSTIKNIAEKISKGKKIEDQCASLQNTNNDELRMNKVGVEIVSSSDNLANYQIPQSCITSAEENRDRYLRLSKEYHFYSQGAHVGSCIVGAGSFCGSVALAMGGFFSGGSLLLIGGILLGAGGFFYCSPALEKLSLDMEQKSVEMAEKVKVWKQLNDITKKAYDKYKSGDYRGFLAELNAKYEVNGEKKRLVEVHDIGLNFLEIKSNFIAPLEAHGFRPDAIAYLLLIFGEVILKYDHKVDGPVVITQHGQKTQIFPRPGYSWGYLDRLICAGTIWSCLSCEMQALKKNLDIWYANLLESTNNKKVLAKEHLEDAMEVPFKARLHELHNLARINLAMTYALQALERGCKDERSAHLREECIEKGLFWYNEVRSQVLRGDYLMWYREERLEALEDLFIALNVQYDIAAAEHPLTLNHRAEQVEQASILYNEHTPLLSEFHQDNLVTDQDKRSYINNIEQAHLSKEQAAVREQELGYLNQEIINNLETALSSYRVSLDIYLKYYTKMQEEPGISWKINLIRELLLIKPELIFSYGKCLLKLLRYSELEKWLQGRQELLELKDLLTSGSFSAKEREEIEKILSDYLILFSMSKRTKNQHKEAMDALLVALDLKAENNVALQEYYILDGVKTRKDKRLIQQNQVEDNADSYMSVARSESSSYKILALDGGGFFGGMPQAYMLSEIEKRMHKPISSLFNMVVALGNSGWMASGLLIKESETMHKPLYSAFDMVKIYDEAARYENYNVFTLLPWYSKWIYGCKYSNEGKAKRFKDMFGERDLSSSMTNLLLPYIKEEKGQRLRMWLDSKQDKTKVADALLATTAARGLFSGRINEQGKAAKQERYFSEELKAHGGEVAYTKLTELGIENKYLLLSLSSVLSRVDISQVAADDVLHSKLGKNYHRWQFAQEDGIDFHEKGENIGELFEQTIVELYQTEDNSFNKLLEQLESDSYEAEDNSGQQLIP